MASRSANASSIGLVQGRPWKALDGLDLYGPHGDGKLLSAHPQPAGDALRAPPGPAAAGSRRAKEWHSASYRDRLPPPGPWKIPCGRTHQGQRSGGELAARYGYKTLSSRCHQTVVEDHHRLPHEREELAQFEANRVRMAAVSFRL